MYVSHDHFQEKFNRETVAHSGKGGAGGGGSGGLLDAV